MPPILFQRRPFRGAGQARRSAGASWAARRAKRGGLVSVAVAAQAKGRGWRTGWMPTRPGASWLRCAGRRCLRLRRNSRRVAFARRIGRWYEAVRPRRPARSTRRSPGEPAETAGTWRSIPVARPPSPIGACSVAAASWPGSSSRRAPAGRTRCGFTARRSAARCWAMQSMAGALAGYICWRARIALDLAPPVVAVASVPAHMQDALMRCGCDAA